MSKNKKTVILLLIAAVLIAVVPLFVLKEAEFGGSDDAGHSKQSSQAPAVFLR